MNKKSIAVIGAGVVGATTAYFLAREGLDVTMIDREVGAALQCSKANGGQISVCNAETWNTWKNVWKGLKWMSQPDAPLLIRRNVSLSKVKWIAAFLYETATRTHKQNTIDTIALGKRSSELYSEIETVEKLQFDQSYCGILHVYNKHDSLQFAKDNSAPLFEEFGVPWKYVSPEEIFHLDPAMKDFKNIGGFFTDTDWVGDAHKFSNEILRVSVEKYGVKTLWSYEVIDVENHKLKASKVGSDSVELMEFDEIVICNGYEIASIAAKLGDRLNVYPVKGYSITIEDARAAPKLSLLDDDKKIVSSTLGSRFRVAGTAEIGSNDLSIRQDRIKPLVKWVNANFPGIDTNKRSEWACLRPMNANMMPIVKTSKAHPNVHYHGGHGHLGWTLAAGTSELLTKRICNL